MAIFYDIDNLEVKRFLDEFLQEIQEYLTLPKYGVDINTISNDGLRVFNQIPFVKTSTLFLLDDETYDFEHIATFPKFKTDTAKSDFDKYIDNRLIDSSYEEGSIFIEKELDGDTFTGILVPMIVSWGIIGVTVIEIEDFPDEYIENFKKVFGIHGRIFASVIERIRLFNELQSSNEILSKRIKQGSNDLSKSRQEFIAIFDKVPVGILLIDKSNHSIFMANPKALDMLEAVTEDDLIGMSILDVTDLREFDNLFSRNDCTLKGIMGKSTNIIFHKNDIEINDDDMIIISFTNIETRKSIESKLKEENSELGQAVHKKQNILEKTISQLEQEISFRRKAEKDLRNVLESERHLSDIKSKFVNNVSHEFRTPLTAIRSSAQLLELYQDKLKPEEKESHFKTIQKMVDSMINIVENSLIVADSEELTNFKKEKISLKLLTLGIVGKLQNTLHKKNKIDVSIVPENIVINHFYKPLSTIIYNLVSNALKYSKDDSPISVKLSVYNDLLTIYVQDQGVGIPDDARNHIFEPFFRGSNVGAASGTGLGLTVVKKHLDLLGGDVSFRSTESGTHFIVSLSINDDE